MKKRFVSTLLMLSIISGIFSGCVINSPDNAFLHNASCAGKENSVVTSEASQEISGVKQTAEDNKDAIDAFFTSLGQEAITKPADIPDYCTETDTPHLYNCPIDIPPAKGFSAYISGSNLLIKSSSYYNEDTGSTQCHIFALDTGNFVKSLDVSLWTADIGVLDDSGFWLFDYEDRTMCFFDKNGEETAVYENVGETEASDEISNIGVSPDGSMIVYNYKEDKRAFLYEAENGTVTEIETDIKGYILEIEYVRDGFQLFSSDYEYAMIDPVTKTAETAVCRKSGAFYGGTYSYYCDNAVLLGNPEEEEMLYYHLDRYERMSSLNSEYMVTAFSHQNTTIRFYDLRKEVMLSEIEFGSGVNGGTTLITDNGTAVVLVSSYENIKLYFYDLVSAAAECSTTPIDVIICTEDSIAEGIEEIKEDIKTETGIEIFYGSEGNDFVDTTYLAYTAPKPFEVYNAVNSISDILKHYPEGMLREAYEDTHDGIKIYLCGSIYGMESDGIDMADGFVTESDGYIIMVLDIFEDLYYNVPHEMSHIFDHRIEYISKNGQTDWINVWRNEAQSFSAYAYTYVGYEDNSEYTIEGEDDPNNVWFIDGYSRTYPTEDRATIMEGLFNPNSEMFTSIFEYENIKDKARLYCHILRQCFPSCNTDETLYWEQMLDITDLD